VERKEGKEGEEEEEAEEGLLPPMDEGRKSDVFPP
jgi:hypothetical protein